MLSIAMKAVGLFVVVFLVLAALLFVSAGRLDWTAGWLCLAIMVVGFSLLTLHVARRTPSLIRRRMRAGAGTPLWDGIIVIVFHILFMAILVVGGLDTGRYGWSLLPSWAQGLGVILMIAALLLLGWAMGQNPHFETTVRIQEDQKHRVIDSGPYRLVRHPGYVAASLLMIGMALTLESGWALVPAALATVEVIVRTALEDRFLHANLEGYREFARRTRYRLVPGVW
jgi:protein-S-isoprenylcysteine O-methyltransferase Ste14